MLFRSLEEMIRGGYCLGGEQSGHIIFSDHATTGDGQLSAIKLMSVMKAEGKKLSALGAVMERYPQVLVNIKADDAGKRVLDEDNTVKQTIAALSDELGCDGRILVRASGTEPLIRVMVEGKNFDAINQCALKIANVIKERMVG